MAIFDFKGELAVLGILNTPQRPVVVDFALGLFHCEVSKKICESS